MRLTLLPLLFIVAGMISACSNTKSITAAKYDQELTVDGNLSGWDMSRSLLEDASEANYYAAYTDNYLYLYVDVRNPQMHQAITYSGLIVYLNNKRDDRKSFGIALPSGVFNLLRENPGVYRDLLTDPEFMQSSSNRRMLTELEPEIFERALIVERFDGSSRATHGFVSYEQIEAEGVKISVNRDRRNYGIEIKVPLDGSSLYEIEKGQIWVGFTIEPPDYRDQNPYYNQERAGMGSSRQHQRRQPRATQQRENNYEKWFKLNVRD